MLKLQPISASGAVRAPEQPDSAQALQKSSQLIMRRGSVGRAAPMHRKIKFGTVAAALRQVGFPRRALRRRSLNVARQSNSVSIVPPV